jgi:hypothetical protein
MQAAIFDKFSARVPPTAASAAKRTANAVQAETALTIRLKTVLANGELGLIAR